MISKIGLRKGKIQARPVLAGEFSGAKGLWKLGLDKQRDAVM